VSSDRARRPNQPTSAQIQHGDSTERLIGAIVLSLSAGVCDHEIPVAGIDGRSPRDPASSQPRNICPTRPCRLQSPSYSSSEPLHHCTSAGLQRSCISLTHDWRVGWVVALAGASMNSTSVDRRTRLKAPKWPSIDLLLYRCPSCSGSLRRVYDSPDDAPLSAGKLPRELLVELLAKARPLPPGVRLGPALGEDAAAIDVPAGSVVVASDPVTLTGAGVARLCVIVNANDVAIMGVTPRWFVATVLFPVGTTRSQARDLFDELHSSTNEAGVALVGGHTEVTPAVNQTVVCGTMLGFADHGELIETAGASPGDVVVQIGEAPIEGALVLGMPAEDGASISVVRAALDAGLLGATAMHDPTEGGLATGLHELATASGLGLVIDESAVLWNPSAIDFVDAAGADSWRTLASGTVLATFEASIAQQVVVSLQALGHQASSIGKAVVGSGVSSRNGTPIEPAEVDEIARLRERDAKPGEPGW